MVWGEIVALHDLHHRRPGGFWLRTGVDPMRYARGQKVAVKIDGRRYYQREKKLFKSSGKPMRGIFFTFLLLQSHVSASGLGTGGDLDRGENEKGGDELSFMARQESTWQPPRMPSPHHPVQSDDEPGGDMERSDGGSGNRGREGEDRFFQMALIFPLFGRMMSAKLDGKNIGFCIDRWRTFWFVQWMNSLLFIMWSTCPMTFVT